jgi:hypothetical protein
MAALDFPPSPTVGLKYPTPPVPGIPVYTWDGEKWTTVGGDTGTLVGATALPLPPVDPAVVGTSQKYAREDHKHPTNAASAAEYLANTTGQNKTMTPKTIWDSVAQVTLVDAASVSPNLNLGSDFVWTVTAAGRTLANPTGGKVGQKGIIYIQLSGGTVTTWGSAYKFPQALKPTLAGLNAISYAVGGDGATMLCSALTGLG